MTASPALFLTGSAQRLTVRGNKQVALADAENFKQLADEVPEQINTEAWAKYQIKRTACNTCPSFCKEVFQIPMARMPVR